ncbi:MAG: hypothetical protein [Olavius algarvensis Gamma 1 endosymbiont]|nr:MAG: hypothetical protein [Olavius algarvensis Gamma 1 endosymbiont]
MKFINIRELSTGTSLMLTPASSATGVGSRRPGLAMSRPWPTQVTPRPGSP